MHRVGIGRRMHGDGGNPHLAAGALDAKRDFSAIGDQDFAEHRRVSVDDHEEFAELHRCRRCCTTMLGDRCPRAAP